MREVPGWRKASDFGRDAPSQASEAIDDELQGHLEGLAEEYRSQGLGEEAAWARAVERFGDPRRIAKECRGASGGGERRGRRLSVFVDALLHDLRRAWLSMRRRPGMTVAMLLTLSIGIGASTAVFTVINGVLMQPLPHPDADELMLVWEVDARPGFYEENNPVTAANFRDWQERNRVFEGMAAYQSDTVTFRGTGEPERVSVMLVGAGFLDLLGVEPYLGRNFVTEEDAAGKSDVVMLSHSFWMSHFHGDREVIGKTVTLESTAVPVIGVLPPDFEYLDQDFAIWSPLGWSEERLQNRFSHTSNVLARLKDGVDVAAAQEDMDRVVAELREEYPENLTGWGVEVEPLAHEVVGEVRPALVLLLAAVAFVLLTAAVNVANLMLTRAASEQREQALRTALGASRGRLLQQRWTESLLLSIVATTLGMALASLGTRLLLSLRPEGLPRVAHIETDLRVLGFAIGLCLVTALFFGAITAFETPRLGLIRRLQTAGRSSTGSRSQNRLRNGFVVSQLAFSLVLLVAAALLVTSFKRLMAIDPGFDRGGLMTMKVNLPLDRYGQPAEQIALYDRLLPELAALPGVRSAAITKFLPLTDQEWTWSVFIEGRESDEREKLDYGRHVASVDFFQTMGIRLLAGRSLDTSDRAERPPVVVVNEAFVDRFFPDGTDPIGQRMSILGDRERPLEIVGVVENVHHYALDEEPLPLYYAPYAQIRQPWLLRQMNVVLRADGDLEALVPMAKRTIAGLDTAIPVSDVSTMQQRVERSVARSRFAMTLITVFAAVALLLAVVGIYSVLSFVVGQRLPEIGVRLALGAGPGTVIRWVLADGLRLTVLGIGLGIVGAFFFSRVLRGLLYGVTGTDPRIYGVVGLGLALMALLATYLPARRASRVDPLVVLRNE